MQKLQTSSYFFSDSTAVSLVSFNICSRTRRRSSSMFLRCSSARRDLHQPTVTKSIAPNKSNIMQNMLGMELYFWWCKQKTQFILELQNSRFSNGKIEFNLTCYSPLDASICFLSLTYSGNGHQNLVEQAGRNELKYTGKTVRNRPLVPL